MPHLIDNAEVFAHPGLPLRVMRVPEHAPSAAQHRHEFHELVVILGGKGTHITGDEVYPIEAGDVFVIIGEMSHAYAEADALSLVNILFDPDRLGIPQADVGSLTGYHALFDIEPRVRTQRNLPNRLRLPLEQLRQVLTLIEDLEHELERQAHGYAFMAIAHLMRLIGFLSRAYSELDGDDRHVQPVPQISKLLGYMERHFAEPLTVLDLMHVAHMSQTSLMRNFRQMVGHAPIEHLIHLRVARARQLLAQTDLPIGEIARAVGIRDGNYLARQFRRVTGSSPRAYRRRHHQ